MLINFSNVKFLSSQALQNGSSESCESASTSSIGSNNSHNNTSKAPGAQLQHKNSSLFQNSLSNGGKATSIVSNSTIPNFPDFAPDLRKQVNKYMDFEKEEKNIRILVAFKLILVVVVVFLHSY